MHIFIAAGISGSDGKDIPAPSLEDAAELGEETWT